MKRLERVGYMSLCTVALFLTAEGGFSAVSDVLDATTLLDRFRSIDWSKREVGQNKDLSDDAWTVRIEVENALIALGKPAVPTLIEACRDSNPHVRLLGAYVLGCLNEHSAVPALMRIVESDPYAPARLAAVEALGRLGAKEIILHGSIPKKAEANGPAPPYSCPSWEGAMAQDELEALLVYLKSLAPPKPQFQLAE